MLRRPVISSALPIARRSISIQQPSVAPVLKETRLGATSEPAAGSSPEPEQLEVAKGDQAVIEFTKDEPVLQTLGTPQSTLSLTVPPSVPVFLKRGSLMSLYASKSDVPIDSVVTSTFSMAQPLRRFFYGGFTSTYQRIIATVPLNLMVSAYAKEGLLGSLNSTTKLESTKSFCNVALDGTLDWAVVAPKSLQVYAGNSLQIMSQKFPKFVKKDPNTKRGVKPRLTGLSGFFQSGYTLLSGRGYVSLVGSGSIFRLGLGEGEQVLVKKGNLLATTVKDAQEFSSGAFEARDVNNRTFEERAKDAEKDAQREKEVKELTTETEDHTPTWFDKFNAWLLKVQGSLVKSTSRVGASVVGNGSYIRVKGPRMLLIQTDTGKDQFIYNNTVWKKPYGVSLKETEKYIGDVQTKAEVKTSQ